MGNLLTMRAIRDNVQKTSENCNIYLNVRPNSGGSPLSGFEGIPQNLVINLLVWIVLNLLFIVLRKKAWNYGRMAVMQKDELNWTDMFYGDDISLGSESGSGGSPHVPHRRNQNPMGAIVAVVDSPITSVSQTPSDKDGIAKLGSGSKLLSSYTDMITNDEKKKNNGDNGNNSNSSKTNLPSSSAAINPSGHKVGPINEIQDTGYFSWIKIVFTLTDQQYLEKCGSDCVSYLSFQRHLIFLAILITCCSLLIILPINMHRSMPKGEKTIQQGFVRTTIVNLTIKQVNFLWAHVVLSIFFLFMSIAVMRHYSKGLQLVDEDSTDVSHTICIIGLNKSQCHEDILRAHITETYPGTEILEVSFAYNISKLQWIEFQRLSASSAKQYFQHKFATEIEKTGEGNVNRPTLRPYLCGVMGWCFKSQCCRRLRCKETDAIEYYTQQEEKYTINVENERQKALSTPLGIAFVTFSTIESAERIVEDYACSARVLLHTPESRYTKELNSNQWIVKFAPMPEDIHWENLTLDFKMWYVKFIVINTVLAIIVIIFSTPVFTFTIILGPWWIQNSDSEIRKERPIFTSAILNTLPTGITWVLGVILISLVYQSDALIGFWTKTAGNLSEMLKIFIFLVFMVIILPALGVTSISYFINQDSSLSWSCIFYKENGALFVNYVCTSSLCGTAAELMRLPELFVYAVKLCFARSIAEVGAIRKSVLWDFQIGSNYAWMMLHFAIFTCFSVIFPLVTPFGLLYLFLKHLVDRYNIYFAYAPCKVEKEVHATAVNFVIMSMFMLQINLLAYVHFHIGHSNFDNSISNPKGAVNTELRALQVFSLLGFSITAALFLGQVCFNVCADFSPIHHFKNMISDQDQVIEVTRASDRSRQSKRQSGRPEKSRRSHNSRGRRSRERKAFPKLQQSNMQVGVGVGVGGEFKLFPPVDSYLPELEAQTQNSERRGDTEQSWRTSLIVSSNYTGSGKPYGRYISPLLRPEFIRLAAQSQNQCVISQQQSQQSQELPSEPTHPQPIEMEVTEVPKNIITRKSKDSNVTATPEAKKSRQKKKRSKSKGKMKK